MEVDLKVKIRDSALDLFRRISYSKTSVSDIAAHAGIGKGTIYLYYPSKEDIMADIIKLKICVVDSRKDDSYRNPDIPFEVKLEKFTTFLVDSFVEIKNLLFGSFENLQGKIIKDVFSSYKNYSELTVQFISELMTIHGINVEGRTREEIEASIDEFFNFIIGRIILYVLETDWDNIEPIKLLINQKINGLFKLFVLGKGV